MQNDISLLFVSEYHTIVIPYNRKVTTESKYILLNKLLTKDHNVFQMASSLSIKNWQFPDSSILLKMATVKLYIMWQVTRPNQNTVHF